MGTVVPEIIPNKKTQTPTRTLPAWRVLVQIDPIWERQSSSRLIMVGCECSQAPSRRVTSRVRACARRGRLGGARCLPTRGRPPTVARYRAVASPSLAAASSREVRKGRRHTAAPITPPISLFILLKSRHKHNFSP